MDDETSPLRHADASQQPVQTPNDANATEPLPHGLKFTLILATLMISCFLAALDMTIVATAVPTITDEFRSLDQVGWYGSAFLLTQATFQSTWGKVYGIVDLKSAFLSSILIFELGCLVSALAQNSPTVIAGRAVAGVGAAGILGGVFVIISFVATTHARPTCIGIVGATFSFAGVVGPLVGGALTSQLSWRWVFAINLPVGFGAVLAFCLVFRTPKAATDLQSPLRWPGVVFDVDLLGTALITAATTCFLLAMQWGGVSKPWDSGQVVAILVLFGVLVVAFVLNERSHGNRALVPLRLLKKWPVWVNCLYTFLLSGANFPLVYFLPIYFQAIQGVNAEESGIRNIPLVLAVSMMTVVSTSFMGRTSNWILPMIFGAILTTVGASLIYTLDIDSPASKWIGYQVILGMGVGIALEVPLVANQQDLPLSDIPTMVGMTLFFELLGGAIFVSAGQAIFSNGLLQKLEEIAPNISGIEVLEQGALNIRKIFGDQIHSVLVSYMAGLQDTFLMALSCAAICVALAIVVAVVIQGLRPVSSTRC
ncbi:putative gliotoxin efflux pump [Annulohypoxylon moriforme]|nr:putative gliotoxin efflux pump [Annulohypoxylon moriforme]